MGRELHEKGRYQQAIGSYLKVLEKDPGNEQALLLQRRAVHEALSSQRLLQRLEQLRIVRQAEGLLRLRRMSDDKVRQAELLLRQSELVAANDLLIQALVITPRSKEALALVSDLQRRLRARIARWKGRVRGRIDDPGYYFLTGFAALNDGNPAAAIREWEWGFRLKVGPDAPLETVARRYLASARKRVHMRHATGRSLLKKALVAFRKRHYSEALPLFLEARRHIDNPVLFDYIMFIQRKLSITKRVPRTTQPSASHRRPVRRLRKMAQAFPYSPPTVSATERSSQWARPSAGRRLPVRRLRMVAKVFPKTYRGASRARPPLPIRPPPQPAPESVSWESLYLDGIGAYMMGDLKTAANLLKKAQELKPENPRIRKALQRVKEESAGRSP